MGVTFAGPPLTTARAAPFCYLLTSGSKTFTTYFTYA